MKLNDMKLTCLIYLMVTLSASILFTSAKEPGFKSVMTDKCMKYLSQATKAFLIEYLQKPKTISKKFHISGVDIEITRINITNIDNGFKSHLFFEPQIGFEHRIRDLSMVIQPLSTAGILSMEIQKLNMSSVIRTKNSNGKLDLDLQSCAATIGNLNVRFLESPQTAKLTTNDDFNRNLKTALQQQFCEYAKKEFVPLLAQRLMNLPTSAPLFDNYFYDYSLSDEPNISPALLETDHLGTAYVMKSSSVRDDQVPFSSPRISFSSYNLSSDPKMVYVFMSNYGLSTLMYFLWKNGVLDYTLSKEKIPSSKVKYLRTDCDETEVCASTLFPSLKSLYPNSYTETTTKPTSAPQIIIQSGLLTMVSSGSIECVIRKPDKSTAFLFSTDADVYVHMKKIELKDYSFIPHVKIADYKLKNFKSSLSEVTQKSLKQLMDFAKPAFLEPELNKLMRNAMIFPKQLNFDMVNGTVEIVPDMIVASIDFCVGCDDKSEEIRSKKVEAEEEYYHSG